MIPHRLQIKNFLSYGADMQTIDFNPHHLIYLSGKNGHGKSALLDAMTWAIWGVARKTTNAVKADQGLLRLGATQMVVIFDFELDNQLYRVKREFIQAAGGKPLAYLEFGMVAHDGAITALTDKTIRATQAVIEKTIRLDYESFINSAFLRQGHANEFSQKSPKDRKEILSAILGLQQFELIKRRALERVKESSIERQTISAVQEAMSQQLEKNADLPAAVELLMKEIAAIKHDDMQLQESKKTVVIAAAQLAQQQTIYEQIRYKIEQQQNLYTEQHTQWVTLVKEWRTIHADQLRLPDAATIENETSRLNSQIAQYQRLMQQRLVLHAQLLQLQHDRQLREREIEQRSAATLQQLSFSLERLRLETTVVQKAMHEQASFITQHTERITFLADEIKQLETTIAGIDIAKEHARYEKRKNSYHDFIARSNWLKAEHDALIAKKDVAHTDNPSCPLCEQNLSAARRKFLAHRFAKQERFLSHQLLRITGILTRLKELLVIDGARLEGYKKRDEMLIIKRTDMERLAVEKKMFELRAKELEKNFLSLKLEYEKQQEIYKDAQAEAQKIISHDEKYKELQQQIETISHQFAAIVYDEKGHQKAVEQIKILDEQRRIYSQIHQQASQQQNRMHEIGKIKAQLKEKKEQLAMLENEKKVFATLPQLLQEQRIKEQQIEEAIVLIQQRKEKAREEHGKLKTRQEMVLRLKEEQKKQQESIEKLSKEMDDYQAIANAAGKDGIQALLIEEAIPEIEQEANILLSRLTNNQSQIFIESLRDLKRGGSKETLDINIADASGIRPYEMFSGGEAFRIDFALRIAISKLLARRAGTALQTLIIDEGFGSQDEEGLSLIMDAIYKIQEDFERLIIVSHLPGMKDQFPVHFVVSKGPNGSAISIVEQA